MLAPDDLLTLAVGLHDPAAGLQAIQELREHLARVEAIHVENALRDGWRWSDVAAGLGLSKQAAHRKYAATMRERLERAEAPAGAPDRRIVVTNEARLAFVLARQEAAAMRRDAVGTEDLLLAVTRVKDTQAAEVLRSLGATREATRAAVETLGAQRRLPAAPPGAEVLRGALREVIAGGEDRLGPEHLLLALLQYPDGGAARALRLLGVEPDVVRERLAPVAVRAA